MNIVEILKLPHSGKEKWLLENKGVFYNLMMAGEHIGLLIRANEDDIKDYLDYPEKEEIDNFIQSYCPEINRKRAEQLRAGATVSDQEKTFLIKAAAMEKSCGDTEGYIRTVCTIPVGSEKVYATFTSVIAGQNEEVNLDNIYKTKGDAIKAINSLSDDEYLFDF
jgi:hypothetical protein